MRRLMLGATLALAVFGVVRAEVIVSPDWARRPSDDDVARYYPKEAIDRSISGRVVLVCTVSVVGELEDCRVDFESPAGMGFGEAVLKMASREFRMKPQTRDGRPVGGAVIRIPISLIAPSESAGYVVTEAVWAEAPTFEDMAAAWPAAAGDIPVGTAVLRCSVGDQRDLRSCKLAGQTPWGSAFAEAAQSLAGKFRIKLTPEEAKTKYRNADVTVSFRFYNPATPAGRAKKIEKPEWITRIDPKKVVALFPKAAMDAGVKEGVGVVDCLVAPDGRMTDCRVAREAPAAMGFGQAALLAMRVMQMDPWTREGRPVAGGRVRVPIQFNLEPEPEDPAGEVP